MLQPLLIFSYPFVSDCVCLVGSDMQKYIGFGLEFPAF